MHFQWGRRTCLQAWPGKRKYYGLFNISHTSRGTRPAGCPSACLPACSTPFAIVVLALLQNHFANPSTCQVTGRCCPASPVAAFHLLEMQKGNSSGSRKEAGRRNKAGRETANIFRVPQTHNEFVTLSLTLEINRKRTWASSINMRQGHDRVSIYISIIYTLWVKLVCVNLLPFRGRKSCFWPT